MTVFACKGYSGSGDGLEVYVNVYMMEGQGRKCRNMGIPALGKRRERSTHGRVVQGLSGFRAIWQDNEQA